MTERFDLVVIGGGYAGYPSAIRASQLGMKVALVEKSKLEGNCLHRGCIPTKALLQSASMLSGLERHGEELGVLTEGVSFDYSRAAKYRDEVVGKLHEGTRYLMRKNGIATYEGTGRFLEPKKIEVRLKEGGKQTLEARYILIASGSAPRSLPGLETDHEQVLTSDDVLTMNSLPSSLDARGEILVDECYRTAEPGSTRWAT